MELPRSYLNKFDQRSKKTSQPRSTWEEQLDLFAARLNPGRIKAGYKPIAMLVSPNFFRPMERTMPARPMPSTRSSTWKPQTLVRYSPRSPSPKKGSVASP
jgi:hypothetical protein